VGIVISPSWPSVVTRPRRPGSSVNHRAPSGPVVIERPKDPGCGSGNSVSAPEVARRPTLSPCSSMNQTLPSGPGVMPAGELPAESGNSTNGDTTGWAPVVAAARNDAAAARNAAQPGTPRLRRVLLMGE